MSIVTVPLRRVFVFMSVVSTMIVSMVVPAFAEGGAEPVEGANATDNVTVTETTYNWFYWPGWAFAALTALVLASVFFFYYKNVLGPKYHGKKVTQ